MPALSMLSPFRGHKSVTLVIVGLFSDCLTSLLLLDAQSAPNPIQGLVANDQRRHREGHAEPKDTALLILPNLSKMQVLRAVSTGCNWIAGQTCARHGSWHIGAENLSLLGVCGGIVWIVVGPETRVQRERDMPLVSCIIQKSLLILSCGVVAVCDGLLSTPSQVETSSKSKAHSSLFRKVLILRALLRCSSFMPSAMVVDTTHYDTLGVPPTATEPEMWSAFQKLVAIYHPGEAAQLMTAGSAQ